MGGRGASSGLSEKGRFYGSDYHTLYQNGNIKYVTKTSRNDSDSLMETMTKGRIYATVNGGEVKGITLFDHNNRRAKFIEKDGRTGKWHAHYGYEHNEYSLKEHEELTPSDRKLLDDVIKKWNNRK